MRDFVAEFQELNSLYHKLGAELAEEMNAVNANDPHSLVGSVLRCRDRFVRIEQMNTRVLQLAADWEKSRSRLDSKTRDEAQSLAAAAKAHALQLKELFNSYVQKIEPHRENLKKRLSEICKGARYLKSVKPIKSNYPKFVDSLV